MDSFSSEGSIEPRAKPAASATRRALCRRRAELCFAALCLTGVSACSSRASPVVISEFVASNTSGLRDVDGETSDWIELHNTGTTSIDLEGWCLTDNRRELQRWCFPSVSVPAQGYLVVFASGKRMSEPGAPLHASFKLKAAEDYLALVQPGGTIADEFAPYPDQRENVAFGRTTRGTRDYLGPPTPGAPNR